MLWLYILILKFQITVGLYLLIAVVRDITPESFGEEPLLQIKHQQNITGNLKGN